MFKRVASILVALALLLVVGCSKAPEAEITTANDAVQAAVQAEAEKYASAEYQMAMDTLKAAKAAVEEQNSKFALFRSYDKAKQLFVASQQLANDAVTKAQAEKERVRNEVTLMMSRVDTLIIKANEALKNAPRGKGSKADLELIKNDLAAVQTAQTEAVNDFNNGDFLTAKTKFEAVVSRTESIIAEIQAAKSKTTKP
jgi:hypothetical protein